MQLEKVHPLQSGFLRMKRPSERRPGLPRERAMSFYLRHVGGLVRRNARFVGTIVWLLRLKRHIERDPNRFLYTDAALMPIGDDEEQTYDHLSKTAGAKAAIEHFKKVAALTH